MHITSCGRGLHKREVKGVDFLKKSLPNHWYAFANLDLVLDLGRAREVDLVIIADRRIFLVDIKDWYGNIESRDGRWFLNGNDMDPSPVAKVTGIARDLAPLLREALQKRPETKNHPVPRIEGLVVLTGKADRSAIAETERGKVLTDREFVARVATDNAERASFGNVAPQFLSEPLTGPFWKNRLTGFFNAGPKSPFKHGRRRFQQFLGEDNATFPHPRDIYREYDAHEEGVANSFGTLRLWNFGECPEGRFQTHEGRLEITGREREVYHWLRDRGDDLDLTLLSPRAEDSERGVNYWEIFDRRRRLKRLSDFSSSEKADPGTKIELARQILAAVAALHRNDAAHLDLGPHSIWLEAPTTVRLSHLLAARFPQVRSLGESRYQFLASVTVPEEMLGNDHGPKRRDVFLLGTAIHHLLFGKQPDGEPPEWNAEVDIGGVFEPLHHWFSEALDLDASKRFPDAGAALEAFNRAVATRPTPDEVAVGLERYRTRLKSQRGLFTAYPAIGEADETDRMDSWPSLHDGRAALVKMWKPAAWGDLRREGPRVLAFLQRASALKVDRLVGIPSILDVLWLGDAIAVVQEWIEGSPLDVLILNPPGGWLQPRGALDFVRGLVGTVDGLHESGFAHGDLKPENVIVRPDGQAVLIDPIDFSSTAEGDRMTSAYAPETGSRFERDRYAILKISEEIFAVAVFEPDEAAPIAFAISECFEKTPKLSTLQPLLESIATVLDRLAKKEKGLLEQERDRLVISIAGAEAGPIEPDEGMLFLRFLNDPERGTRILSIRGSVEEIQVRLDQKGKPLFARRRKIDQGRIARIARYEFHSIASDLVIDRTDISDLSELLPLLSDPIVTAKVIDAVPVEAEQRSAELDEEKAEAVSEEAAEDVLAEEIAFSAVGDDAESVDVPLLWRTLIDTEKELTIEGVAERDSFFDRAVGLHRVPLQLESGAFDFSPTDRVGVERQDRRGWRRIGELDLQRSRSDMAAILANDYGSPLRTGLVSAGQRLRFVSHFEVQSLSRRSDAVNRILAGDGRTKDLLSVFDPRSHAAPIEQDHVLDMRDLKPYDLNDDQQAAFEKIVRMRPVGLVQGPPGTGKTRFIAGLAHYAITKGLAKNVLLSSQSHEAVNTAAEAVLKLFRKSEIEPNILRVAVSEDVVSDGLQPFYTARIEQALKDRFRASFKARLEIVARSFGLPDEIAGMVLTVESAIRPVVAKLADLKLIPDYDIQRYNGLLDTLRSRLLELGIEQPAIDEEHSWDGFVQIIVERAIEACSRSHTVSADQVARLFTVAAIGSDFIGSVSRGQRSFEPFLAGTRQIVIGTCVGLGRTALGVTSTPFDLVIVDEAARCTSSELLVPLQAAHWAVLVGDHAQLEPSHEVEVVKRVSKSTGIAKREIRRSDFERVFSTPYGKIAGTRLKKQYRMLPPIGRLVSAVFYSDLKLEPGRTVPEIDPELLPPGLELPLTWVETDPFGEGAFEKEIEEGTSRINQTEVNAIVALLERWCAHEPFRDWLTSQTKHAAGIGVICMYAAQRDLVRRTLMRSSLGHLVGRNITIGTVDSYQGKENPVTVVSLVRNNRDGVREGEIKTIKEGFLTTPNRINVAVSRAMDRLVIVGARSRWRAGGPVGRLSDFFEKLVDDKEAVAVGVDSILGAGRVDIGDKRRRRRKDKNKKGAVT